ncbi:fungal-specific transcription factor domain-containing protein [Lasiosphaeria hispida]|uniref:Fungal-specific transcription factor domain-containing protein n=1 Tax=Lasiosphaeria hispida TaxID=260671 RepID=A0AAJ0HJ90_9PEZI|nr:fungal-specific transcription factor domain-containing protein [Lasiosphaeria hispida]
MPQAESQTATSQQCWECRRRRLVCDATHPVCTKCRVARIVCPGYADKKPLKWLAPGQVTSRSRGRNRKPTSPVGGGPGVAEHPGLLLPPPTLQKLELRDDTCDIVEALAYYNTRLYPDAISHQLAPNPFIIPIPSLHLIPASIVHALVSVAISHRLFQIPRGASQSKALSGARSRLYHHRGIAIRLLNELVGSEQTRSGDVTIASVYALLVSVLQQSTEPPCWRPHAEFIVTLVGLRAPLPSFVRSSPHMQVTILAFLTIGILANTTSPPLRQFPPCLDPETTGLVAELYGQSYYPSFPCPKPLFLHIITINNLRSQVAACRPHLVPNMATDVTRTLAQIEAFSPEDWASSQPSLREDWALIGHVFRSAVALYCIKSLHGAVVFLQSSGIKATKTEHAKTLLALLKEAQARPHVRRCMAWPLVVAGVDATGASVDARAYVADELSEMSRDQGTGNLLVARDVLRRFWASRALEWDDCFREPYALVV